MYTHIMKYFELYKPDVLVLLCVQIFFFLIKTHLILINLFICVLFCVYMVDTIFSVKLKIFFFSFGNVENEDHLMS